MVQGGIGRHKLPDPALECSRCAAGALLDLAVVVALYIKGALQPAGSWGR